ncbi:MAG TPA: alpha/beta hydrolase-fold protein [Lacunisphaera sp.]|jgi:esterase/lipase superfamily enzyme|nr:esterase family protein [Lacunisphaera sp.]HQY04745.1 alpha/beta hydrolase-fold protein [Lacunisphaera sp.]
MHRELHQWHSPSLNKPMEVAVYGQYGFALLMFPTAAADYLEYERFHVIDAIAPYINSGRCKVFSINSINNESWLNDSMHPRHKAIRHQQFNAYVTGEVLPFIHSHCGGRVLTIATGASFGALHSANTLFRRPDLIDGCIAMSGSYDLKDYTKGYWDEDVYFNSPIDYLPGLNDEGTLAHLRAKKHIYFVSGQGSYEKPSSSVDIGLILGHKGIPHEVSLWGHDVNHDWPWWRKMLPHYLGTKF